MLIEVSALERCWVHIGSLPDRAHLLHLPLDLCITTLDAVQLGKTTRKKNAQVPP